MASRRAAQEMSLGGLLPGEPPMTLHLDAAARKPSARSVEFIAKAGKTDELRRFLHQTVAPLLRDRAGFLRSIVLTTQGAPRRVVMITFWDAERGMPDLWEENPVVREKLAPLIDAASRTSSYQVEVTEITDTPSQAPSHAATLQVANCNRISTTVRQQVS